MDHSISHIAVSHRADVFATAAFERTVTLWSLPERRELIALETVMDFGGRRLAVLGGEDPLLIAGAYQVHGLAAYSVREAGAVAWRRKDLKSVQIITKNEASGLVAAGFEYTSLHLLDARTGETRLKVRGGKQAAFSPSGDRMAVLGDGWFTHCSTDMGLPLHSKIYLAAGVLDAACSETHVLMTVQSGLGLARERDIPAGFTRMDGDRPAELRCYDTSGVLCWSLPSPGESFSLPLPIFAFPHVLFHARAVARGTQLAV